jgi:acyl-CoA synthetase (NDP forming)
MATTDRISQLDAILKPKSVAVIGASTNPEKFGHEVLLFIR